MEIQLSYIKPSNFRKTFVNMIYKYKGFVTCSDELIRISYKLNFDDQYWYQYNFSQWVPEFLWNVKTTKTSIFAVNLIRIHFFCSNFLRIFFFSGIKTRTQTVHSPIQYVCSLIKSFLTDWLGRDVTQWLSMSTGELYMILFYFISFYFFENNLNSLWIIFNF